MVMVQGWVGGMGVVFNLGEIIVMWVLVWLVLGQVGYGYVQGCDKGYVLCVVLIDVVGWFDIIVILCVEENVCCVRIVVEVVVICVEFFILV